MSTSLVNIGAVHKDDIFYRYKMPQLELVVEGRGNGIKTKVVNVDTIAKALDRSSHMIMRYFSVALGTGVNGNIIRGKHSLVDIEQILSSFIDVYVLCSKCTNPETTLRVKGDNLRVSCKACGEKYCKNANAPYLETIIKSVLKEKQSK